MKNPILSKHYRMLMLTSAPHRMKIAHFGTGVLLEGYFQKKGET
jgi:hypothetical protein